MDEFFGAIIGIGVIAWLVYLLVKYVIAPIAYVLLIIIFVISTGYAFFVSLRSFISAFKDNLDPYKTFVDSHQDAPQGVKRNYCFGPGLNQLSQIVQSAFENLGDQRTRIKEWKNKTIRYNWIVDIWIYLGYVLAIFCVQVLGCVWVCIFSAILLLVIGAGSSGFFMFFSFLWLTDRIVLLSKSIQVRCPNCKRKSVIPTFECPACGLKHNKLVPGPYGILKRKCVCGTMLATTFIGGRSKYKAYCPYCDIELNSSDSRQYGIQLVGGIGVGKTSYLAAFWHEYKEWLNQQHGVLYEALPTEAFANLEDWFIKGHAEATLETNASMYSIFFPIDKSTPIQMTMYDIAGEIFDFAEANLQQQQFQYCEGFLLMIDPTATAMYISETIANFVNSFEEIMGKQAKKRAMVPVAVLITKSDLYKREIGFPRLRATYKSMIGGFEANQEDFSRYINNVCRTFLLEHGYDNTVNLIESEFSNIRYFPVSAMGHNMEEGQYEPWGVLEPMFWLMSHDNCPLHESFVI